MDPRVSVIIPTKDRPHYVAQAICSVLNQEFRDFEILVVDGTAEDHTEEVISKFTDQRIRYIPQEIDKGVSAARNLGITRSRGEFVAFLDDDDLWMPRMLEAQLCQFIRKPWIGAVCTSAFLVRKDGKSLGRWHPYLRGNIFPKILEKNYLGNCSGMMVRKNCFERAGLFDENLPAAEDWDMWIRLAKFYDFDYVDEPLLLYRIHGESISNDLNARLKAEKLLFEKFSPELRKIENAIIEGNWHYELGKLYCVCKAVRKGREEFAEAIEVNPRLVMCYLRLFASFFGIKAYDISRRVLESAFPIYLKSKIA